LVGLIYYYSLVRYQEEELERLKRGQKTTTTSLVGLAYFYSLVRYQEEELERMKREHLNNSRIDSSLSPPGSAIKIRDNRHFSYNSLQRM
jgi:hypothetical protein